LCATLLSPPGFVAAVSCAFRGAAIAPNTTAVASTIVIRIVSFSHRPGPKRALAGRSWGAHCRVRHRDTCGVTYCKPRTRNRGLSSARSL